MSTVPNCVYADYAATTPCDERVVQTMMAAFADGWGNPSSRHYSHGRRAATYLEQARAQLGQLLGAREDELIFTSGASEACNMIIKGVASAQPDQQLVIAATEHPAVIEAARSCAQAGVRVHWLGVDRRGQIDYDDLDRALQCPTSLVAVMLVNNQTGVSHNMALLAERCHAAGAYLMSDITQALARQETLRLQEWGVDFAACSAHKCYGPQGCGLAYQRRGLHIPALIDGGGQERGRRGGTEAVALIAGFGTAAQLQYEEGSLRLARLHQVSRQFRDFLAQEQRAITCYGSDDTRAPGIFLLGGADAPSGWLRLLGTIACSPGSSCASGGQKPSHVLTAMGLDDGEASNVVRISLSHLTSDAELQKIISQLRASWTP